MEPSDQLADDLLVIAAQQGAGDALSQLVERWQDRLWRHAWRLTDDEQAAWDVVQESWIAISRNIRSLHDPSAFAGWAYRITSNKACDWVRRVQRERRANQHYSDRVEQSRSREPTHENLRDALAHLAGRDRAILSLRYEENFATVEIAEILQIPTGTVKSRLHYARERLRRFLKEEDHV